MIKEQLHELLKSLSAYLVCFKSDTAIVDRPALDEAIKLLRQQWEQMP